MPYMSGKFGTSSGGIIRCPGVSRIRSNILHPFIWKFQGYPEAT